MLPILSDFSITVETIRPFRPTVEHTASAEYRLIDMNSTTNLNRINITVYWKDRFGGLHPFLVVPHASS